MLVACSLSVINSLLDTFIGFNCVNYFVNLLWDKCLGIACENYWSLKDSKLTGGYSLWICVESAQSIG